MLQKQIYYFTKKHKLSDVHNLQIYLIGSNEAKLLAIKYALKTIFTYYFNLENHHYNNIIKPSYHTIKVIITHYLLNSKTLNIIRETIRQNLIYLSLEPYKRGKINKNICKNINKFNNYIYSITRRLTDQQSFIEVSKNISVDIIVSRLQLPRYIDKLIISWLHSGYIIFTNKILNIHINCNNRKKHNTYSRNYINSLIFNMYLSDLIFQITCLDTIWYMFILATETKLTFNGYVYRLNKLISQYEYKHKLTFDIITNQYSQISIRDFFYLTRIHNYLKNYLTQYTKKLTKHLKYLYYEYINLQRSFIYFRTIKNVNTFLNVIIYNYLRKKYTEYSNLSNFKVFNDEINLYTYRYNLYIYYINFASI